MVQLIGISGAHRTGKTTLAKGFAKKVNGVFVPTDFSSVFKEAGIKPDANLQFPLRMEFQWKLLANIRAMCEGIRGGMHIMDRTPIDLIAYTLYYIAKFDLNHEAQMMVQTYIEQCIGLANSHFSLIYLIQPGIENPKEGSFKARLDAVFQDHLNQLMKAYLSEESFNVPAVRLSRGITDYERRLTLTVAMMDQMRAPNSEAKIAAAFH